MTVADILAERAVSEVVHFTTSHGCCGTLYTKLLQSRQRLEHDDLVQYLFAPNANFRKDVSYLDHVSLSIQHINHQFYNTSSGSWHRADPIFWCILAFDPVVLTHADVEFATTNNIYSGVTRQKGSAGLERLFAPVVTRWVGNSISRYEGMPAFYPTCFQAEALYPAAVSTEFLQRIYVFNQSDQSEVVGFAKASFHNDVEVVVAPEKFGARP